MQKGKSGAERLPLLVYRTCLDPWSMVHDQFNSMPVTYIILTQAADGCIIGFNIYLYKYLDKQSRENTGEISNKILDTNTNICICACLYV